MCNCDSLINVPLKFPNVNLMLKSTDFATVVVRLYIEHVDKVVDDLADLSRVILRRFSQGRSQLMPEFFPLFSVLVDHADVVVNVRTRLAVVDVGGVVRPLGCVAPELEDGVDVVAVVQVDQREVHEAFLANHWTEAQVFVVVRKMVFGSETITKCFRRFLFQK